MENDESLIESIKTKVHNILSLKKTDRTVLGKVEKMGVQRPTFRVHYYSPYGLATDIRLIDDVNKRNQLVTWLKERKSADPIIKEATKLLSPEEISEPRKNRRSALVDYLQSGT